VKDKNWISVDDELPFQNWKILVQNGQKKHEAIYYRKKWLVTYEFYRCGCDSIYCDCEVQYKIVQLHKVTHWYKCPVTYPKVPKKDLQKFLDQCKRYKRQVNCYSFNCGTCDKAKGECRCDDYCSVCKNEKVACVCM